MSFYQVFFQNKNYRDRFFQCMGQWSKGIHICLPEYDYFVFCFDYFCTNEVRSGKKIPTDLFVLIWTEIKTAW